MKDKNGTILKIGDRIQNKQGALRKIDMSKMEKVV